MPPSKRKKRKKRKRKKKMRKTSSPPLHVAVVCVCPAVDVVTQSI
jgi:hypothetical protein